MSFWEQQFLPNVIFGTNFDLEPWIRHLLAMNKRLSTFVCIQKLKHDYPMLVSNRIGKVTRVNDAAGRYVEFCKSCFPAELNLRGIKIALEYPYPPMANKWGSPELSLYFFRKVMKSITLGGKPRGDREPMAATPRRGAAKVGTPRPEPFSTDGGARTGIR